MTHLENFNSRGSLFFSLIENNPGIRFNEIMKLTGLKNGVTSYYTQQLEYQGKIYSVRTPRVTRFYTQNISEHIQILFKWLRQKTPQKILKALLNGGLFFKELVNKVEKSPSNTSYFISKLVNDHIICLSLKNKKRFYQINSDKKDQLFFLIQNTF